MKVYIKKNVLMFGIVLSILFTYGCGGLLSAEELFTYQETEEGTIEIIGLTESGMEKEKLTVPKQINGKQVTSIAEYAFYNCTWLEEISLPESIKKIGENAFQHCDNLKSDIPVLSFYEKEDGTVCVTGFTNENAIKVLTIPEVIYGKTVTEIGFSAFEDSDIEEIYFPITLERINRGAFRNCYYLKELGLPESLTCLEEQVFKGCSSLETVWWSPTLETIPASCFEGCLDLSFIWIPEGVKRIEENAFQGTDSLLSISIPASVEYISDKAFSKNIFWEYFITFITPEGSYAEQYAKDNRINLFFEYPNEAE